MFDNLIARAIVPVTIAVTGFVIFVCILLYSFVKSDMTAEAIRNLDNCASTVVKSTKHAMMEDDQRAIQNIVENIGTRSDVGLIRIYDQAGKVRYNGSEEPEVLSKTIDAHIAEFLQIDPSAKENVQHEVDRANGHISVSLPILNEPKCSTAACHFHAEDEPVLGFLSVGVSSENLENTLAVLRYRMIIFSIMVLFLTIGGVTALLRMNLFLPILRLTYNAEQATQGVAEYDLPTSDHKLGKLNKDFRILVKQRDQALRDLQAMGTPARNVGDGSDDS
ncbi:MAG: hypothetical protein PF441_05145 [Desulfuromusa sp.]|jgi:sensor histidine kinase regulating citrate/malate metabolism|nr:hypothetical protein [Desulfuromusa sp.]